MEKLIFRSFGFCLMFAGLLLMNGCRKDPVSFRLSADNQWILDSMNVYYFWKDQLPKAPKDQSNASQFFKSVLYSADRFSYLDDPAELKTAYSSFAWYGFEYAIVENSSAPNGLIGVVTLVVPNGPADQAGLKRGDLFTAVNDISIRPDQLDQVHLKLRLGEGLTLAMGSMGPAGISPGAQVSIKYFRHSEMPVYLQKIFSNGPAKIGYIYYNAFDGNYDHQVLEAIRSLSDQGASELILDLRYNPGGDVSSAAKIAAVLSKVTAEQAFVIYQANSNGGRRISSFQQTMNENNYLPQSFAQLLNYRMKLNRVVILTTGATASAAELLINNLKPYLEVIQIGTATIGKDMASFAITDMNVPKKTNLILHPLVFKLYNAMNAGGYQDGIQPDYLIDEFKEMPLRPFGDAEDPMIKKALDVLGAQSSRIAGSTGNPAEESDVKYQSSVLRTQMSRGIEVYRGPRAFTIL